MGSGLSKHPDEVRAADPSTTTTPRRVDQQKSASAVNEPTSTAPKSTESGGCPMKQTDGSYSFDWGALFRKDFPHGPGGSRPISKQDAAPQDASSCPVKQQETPDGCPVKHQEYNVYSQPIDPKNNMPQVANQLPAPGQSQQLSTNRVSSTIPKGGASHEDTTWTYPSPQMFYNALARKGKLQDTDEGSIESVVALHNNMNEKTWRKVLEWEATTGQGQPKLLKFQGRPTDLSPKAWFKHNILGHPLPFDRHDWTVLRPDGTTVRYVIDYYYDESRAREDQASAMPQLHDTGATSSLLVDVRPALDGISGLWYRSITMPYARHVSHTTPFEPLPLRPTNPMKSQVQESVQVWQNIQMAAAGNIVKESIAKESTLSQAEAQEIAKNFAKALSDCQESSQLLDQCQSDDECARASMDWTLCMGKIVCPLQYQTLVEALGDENNNDDKIELALERVNDCLALKTIRHAEARQLYPHVFEKNPR